MNYLRWSMIASSVLAIACSVEMARQLARTRYAVEQLNMRIGLVEVVQWRAEHPLATNVYYVKLAGGLLSTNRVIYGGSTNWTNLTNGVADFKRKASWAIGNTNYTVFESEPRP